MSDKLAERLKEFTYQRPSASCMDQMAMVRQAFMDLCTYLDGTLPECRNKSLAFTALEECSTRAMKALSHNDHDSVQESP